MYNMVPGVGEGAPPLSLNNAQYASSFVPEAGQVCYIKDLGFFKIGDGVTTWASLSYMPRRWSAAATNLLATTNGDGNEKTVGSIVIPANTLAVDGDVVELTLRAVYLNNTTVAQTPQFGFNFNAAANTQMSVSGGQSINSYGGGTYVVFRHTVTRRSSTQVDIDPRIEYQSVSVDTISGVTQQYGSSSWGVGQIRVSFLRGVGFICEQQNTINFKMILVAYGTPALHQITGVSGRGILLT